MPSLLIRAECGIDGAERRAGVRRSRCGFKRHRRPIDARRCSREALRAHRRITRGGARLPPNSACPPAPRPACPATAPRPPPAARANCRERMPSSARERGLITIQGARARQFRPIPARLCQTWKKVSATFLGAAAVAQQPREQAQHRRRGWLVEEHREGVAISGGDADKTEPDRRREPPRAGRYRRGVEFWHRCARFWMRDSEFRPRFPVVPRGGRREGQGRPQALTVGAVVLLPAQNVHRLDPARVPARPGRSATGRAVRAGGLRLGGSTGHGPSPARRESCPRYSSLMAGPRREPARPGPVRPPTQGQNQRRSAPPAYRPAAAPGATRVELAALGSALPRRRRSPSPVRTPSANSPRTGPPPIHEGMVAR